MKERLLNSINHHLVYKTTFLLSLLGIFILIVDFGFTLSQQTQPYVNQIYFIVLCTGLIATGIRYLKQSKKLKKKRYSI